MISPNSINTQLGKNMSFEYCKHYKEKFKPINDILLRDSVEDFTNFVQENKIDINEDICDSAEGVNFKLITAATCTASVKIVKYLLDQKCKLDCGGYTELCDAIFHSISNTNDKGATYEAIAHMLLCHGANPKHSSVVTQLKQEQKPYKLHSFFMNAVQGEKKFEQGLLLNQTAMRLKDAGFPKEAREYYERSANAGYHDGAWNLSFELSEQDHNHTQAIQLIEKHFDAWTKEEKDKSDVIKRLQYYLTSNIDKNDKIAAAEALQKFHAKIGNHRLAKKYSLLATKYSHLLSDEVKLQPSEKEEKRKESKLNTPSLAAFTRLEENEISYLVNHNKDLILTVNINADCALLTRLYFLNELLICYSDRLSAEKTAECKKLFDQYATLWRGLCHLYQINDQPFSFTTAIQHFEMFIREKEKIDAPAVKEAKIFKAIAIAHRIFQAQSEENSTDQAYYLEQLLSDTNFAETPIFSFVQNDLISALIAILMNLKTDKYQISLFEILIKCCRIIDSSKNEFKNYIKIQTKAFDKIKSLPQLIQQQNYWEAFINRLNENHAVAFKNNQAEFQKFYIDELASLEKLTDKPELRYYLYKALAECYSRNKNDKDGLKIAMDYMQKSESLAKQIGKDFDKKAYLDILNQYVELTKVSQDSRADLLSTHLKRYELGESNGLGQAALLDEKQIPKAIDDYEELIQKGLKKQKAQDILIALQNLTQIMNHAGFALRPEFHKKIETAVMLAYNHNPLFANMSAELCDIASERILKSTSGFSQSLRDQLNKQLQTVFLQHPKHHDKVRQQLLKHAEEFKAQITMDMLAFEQKSEARIGSLFSHTDFTSDYEKAEEEYAKQKDELGRNRVIAYWKMAMMFYAQQYDKHEATIKPTNFEVNPALYKVTLNTVLEFKLQNALQEKNPDKAIKYISRAYHTCYKSLGEAVRDSIIERIIQATIITSAKSITDKGLSITEFLLSKIIRSESSEFLIDKAIKALTPFLKKQATDERTLRIAAQRGNAWAAYHLAKQTGSYYIYCKAILLASKDLTFPADRIEELLNLLHQGYRQDHQYSQLAHWYLEIIESAKKIDPSLTQIDDVDVYIHYAASIRQATYDHEKIAELVKKGARNALDKPETYEAWILEKMSNAQLDTVAEAKEQAPPAFNPQAQLYPSLSQPRQFVATIADLSTLQRTTKKEGLYPSFEIEGEQEREEEIHDAAATIPIVSTFNFSSLFSRRTTGYIRVDQAESALPSAPESEAIEIAEPGSAVLTEEELVEKVKEMEVAKSSLLQHSLVKAPAKSAVKTKEKEEKRVLVVT